MMNPNLATKVTLCLVAVAALVATSLRSKDAFSKLRGSPTSISANTGARKLQLGLLASDFGLKNSADIANQAVSMSFALNPLSFAPPPPAPAAAPAAAPAPANKFAPDGPFAIVSNNDGSDTVKSTGTNGENSVVEAKNDSNNSSGRTSGTAFGDSTVGDPKPAPEPEPELTNVLSQFVPKTQTAEVADLSMFGGPKKEEAARGPLTAQERTTEQFALFFSGNP